MLLLRYFIFQLSRHSLPFMRKHARDRLAPCDQAATAPDMTCSISLQPFVGLAGQREIQEGGWTTGDLRFRGRYVQLKPTAAQAVPPPMPHSIRAGRRTFPVDDDTWWNRASRERHGRTHWRFLCRYTRGPLGLLAHPTHGRADALCALHVWVDGTCGCRHEEGKALNRRSQRWK